LGSRGVILGHTDYVDSTDFWSLGAAFVFIAAQEINQINLNLGAEPRNRGEEPWMALGSRGV
jgi:hypothetical protein